MKKYEIPKKGDYAIVMKGKTPRRGTRVFVEKIEKNSAWCRLNGEGYMKIDLKNLTKQ